MKLSASSWIGVAVVAAGLVMIAAALIPHAPKQSAAETAREQHRAELRQLAETQSAQAQAAYNASASAQQAKERAESDREDVLIRAAKGYVTEHLKAPATASFQPSGAKELTPGIWKLFGEVDSQNSFGAMLRSPWTVVVRESDRHVFFLRVGDEKTGSYSEALVAAGVPTTAKQ